MRLMNPVSPTPDFRALFASHAESSGILSFAQFMQLALYDPHLGYYRQDQARIGYGRDTDFFTASTSNPVFGELVAAAVVNLLGPNNPRDFTFVEIGTEPDDTGHPGAGGVLAGIEHPFGAVRSVRIGEVLQLTGRCIVFSNELFDAQPFHRYIFRAGRWRELGVALEGENLVERELPDAKPLPDFLPLSTTEGYIVDAPIAAAELASAIATQPWSGLFVACDYGKPWSELIESTPGGTARGYYRHRQTNHILERPGQQDLTCHICWDWIETALQQHGFASRLQSQESFFVHHAGETVAKITAAEAHRFSQRKLALIQLLHPAHLGQKFQVLHGWRN